MMLCEMKVKPYLGLKHSLANFIFHRFKVSERDC